MSTITGKLLDLGAGAMAPHFPELFFIPSSNAVSDNIGGIMFSTQPIKATLVNDGFTVDLVPSDECRPYVTYRPQLRWLTSHDGSNDLGYSYLDFPDWKLHIPFTNASISSLDGIPANPRFWWVSETTPPPSGSRLIWLVPSTGLYYTED